MSTKHEFRGMNPKTVGRLSLYSRALQTLANSHVTNVFSMELAKLSNTTRSQVRQDIMGLGYKGTPQYGYEISKLQQAIAKKVRSNDKQNLIMLGAGHLGKAILQFFQQNHPNINLMATLDVDEDLIGRRLNGVPVLSIDQLEDFVIKEEIHLAILAVPSRSAQRLTDRLTAVGIRSILNFTAIRLHVPDGVFVENNDISISLERMAFFGSRPLEVEA